MEVLQLVVATAWTTAKIIVNNPFLLAVTAISALSGVATYALKRR